MPSSGECAGLRFTIWREIWLVISGRVSQSHHQIITDPSSTYGRARCHKSLLMRHAAKAASSRDRLWSIYRASNTARMWESAIVTLHRRTVVVYHTIDLPDLQPALAVVALKLHRVAALRAPSSMAGKQESSVALCTNSVPCFVVIMHAGHVHARTTTATMHWNRWRRKKQVHRLCFAATAANCLLSCDTVTSLIGR